MKTTITASTGHTLFVRTITRDELPANLDGADDYATFYRVSNWEDGGHVFMYVGKGHTGAPRQRVVWYPNGKLWSSYGASIEEAINGAIADGWMYAN